MKVRIEGLRHRYDGPNGTGRPALDVERLELESGARHCLVGRSGSGKTTLLSVLSGVLVPGAGRVWLGETDLFALSESQRDAFRARRIGCVFQTLNLLDGLTALENLTLAQRFAGIAAGPARHRALELLDELGLAGREDARPGELSLGEQQRLAIARAVCKRPNLVLADEPTASLDDDNARAALDLLLSASGDGTVVVVSHDARAIERFSSVIRMDELVRSA